ncbi:MAG: hypothetical protein HRU41_11885 [Saprospiraceae bacterium]|nr:hypothetical protein [Saprospiraceae bacterium]
MEQAFMQEIDRNTGTNQPKQIYYYLLILGFLFVSTRVRSSDIQLGDPFIRNYPTAVYQAGIQNWEIAQHPNGYIFLANNNGLLQYDGNDWQCFPLEKKTIARSLLIRGDSIFVGGQNEFGYFKADQTGFLQYHSLLDLIPDANRNFEDVWDLSLLDESIYFYASNKLYKFQDQRISVVYEHPGIRFLAEAGGKLFLQSDEDLMVQQEGSLKPLGIPEGVKKDIVFTSALSLANGSILFTTLKDGLYLLVEGQLTPWSIPGFDAFIRENRIYCATKDRKGRIILGTSAAGVLVLSEDFRLETHINRNNGLQKNNVLSLLTDNKGNLWIGLDNGIDYAEINGDFTQIIPDQPLEGTAYTFIEYNDYFYFGTSSGLYALEASASPQLYNRTSFTLVPGTQGQVWGLAIVQDRLLMGHHEGAFEIKRSGSKHSSRRLSKGPGTWNFTLLPGDPNGMVAGTYEGLELYQLGEEGWEWQSKVDGLSESSRFLVPDEVGNIWMAHPYRGIYKLRFSPDHKQLDVQLYGQKDGLASDHLNHVFSVNDEVLFTSEQGVYRYDASSNSFKQYQEVQELLLDEPNLLRIFEDPVGNIWFVGSSTSGRLSLTDRGVVKRFDKELYPSINSQLVRGFEFIYPLDNERIIAGAEKGFITFDPTPDANAPTELRVLFQSIYNIAEGDTLILAGHYSGEDITADDIFRHFENAFRFSFTAPIYSQHDKIWFQCKLDGSDESWSSWNTKRTKEYTNLSPGDYTFKLRAKNQMGIESAVINYHFMIAPPWYASNLAKVFYVLLVIGLILGLILIPRSRFKKETANLVSAQRKKEEEHQKKVAESEKAIIALQNKNLEEEIRHKNQELASTTMHLVQRSEMINKLRSQLEKLQKEVMDAPAKKQVDSLLRLLTQDDELAREWDQFAHHFDQVHSDFLKRLKLQFPQLTSNDQKLCAYLRMNLATKEIAPLMNISIRGVEVGRYRLRKKLSLDTQVDLNEFMMNI